MKGLLLIFCVWALQEQIRAQDQSDNSKNFTDKYANRIYGKIVDGKTKRGIEAASIQLFIYFNDPGLHTRKDTLAGGMLSRSNGDFSIENLPAADSLRLEITAIGYEDYVRVLYRSKERIGEVDLGNITMQQDARFLNTVTVVGQKPALEMGIDRKTFNVEKSIISTGGTAIDIMKNIPSVSVDIDGNVTLRNNTPQIFVDGLPTILTLDQIPADNIERVELITNPSAKFDASSRGGIINIILKKNRKAGLNGIASFGAGQPDIINSNLIVNLRQGKFNFFAGGNYNQSGGSAKGETQRINKAADTIQNYFNQYSLTDRLRRSGLVRFGFDLFATNRSTITFTQNFVKGKYSSDEVQDQEYFNYKNVLEKTGDRTNAGSSVNNRNNTQLSFKYKFPAPGKEFTADINYSAGKADDSSHILNSFYLPDGTSTGDPSQVRNGGSSSTKQFTLQADFVIPKGPTEKFETGIRSYFNNYSSIFDSYAMENGGEIKLPLSNNFSSKERVHAAYGTYSNKFKDIDYQLGLRFEYSELQGEEIDSARKFGYEYPSSFENIFDALFPSIFLTKNLGEETEIQLNFSRRVSRPNFRQINPYINIIDPANLQRGNPELKPEFSNSIEFNLGKEYESGNFLAVLYFQNNQHEIIRYSDTISDELYKELSNAAIDPNAILNTYINAKSSNELGLEFTWQQRIGKFFDITPTVDLQYITLNVAEYNLSNRGFKWDGQVILNYRIETKKPSVFNKVSFQLLGEYESKEVTAQGESKEQYFMDFGLRKDFLKNNKASFTFSINDIFNTNRYGNIYDTDYFYQESYRRRNVRSFRATITYRFGKSDFSLFKRSEKNGNEEEGSESGR